MTEFIVALLLVGIIAYGVLRAPLRKAPSPELPRSPPGNGRDNLPLDPKNQVAAVSDTNVAFSAVQVMNHGETRVFYAAQDVLKKLGLKGWHVFPQVSLGEILEATPRDSMQADRAYRSINSKRCDVLIADKNGHPKAALEYQGHDHFQGTAHMRDAIKKIALERAGILFVEIEADLVGLALKERLMDRLRALKPPAEASAEGDSGRA